LSNEKSERPVIYCGGGIISANASQELVEFAEDIGRHNAVDKVFGACFLAGRDPAGVFIVPGQDFDRPVGPAGHVRRGGDDPLDERMPDDVAPGELDDGNPLDISQGGVGLEAGSIAPDGGDGELLACEEVADRTVQLRGRAFDLEPVPPLGVPDVADGDVVVLAPEERHVRTPGLAEHRARDRLTVTDRDLPVLDAHHLPVPRIARDIARGPHPGCGAQLRIIRMRDGRQFTGCLLWLGQRL